MEAVYEWVRNITYYMIFITVAGNLLADSKYEKYLRFFAGMVLILLVLKPLTGNLRLDERIAYLFESITFQKESGDFRDKLWGMEDQRLNQVMNTYESAVSVDLRGMAETAGYSCRQVRVRIGTDRDSPYYGHVTGIYMKVGSSKEGEEGGAPGIVSGGPIEIPKTKIEVEPVKIGEGDETAQPGAAGGSGSQDTTRSLPADNSERVKLNGFLRKVAGYYGLETTHVQMDWEDD